MLTAVSSQLVSIANIRMELKTTWKPNHNIE